MTDKKLTFAIFGSKSGASNPTRINQLIEKLISYNAIIYIEKQYLNFIDYSLNTKIKNKVTPFDLINFKADFIISLGGDGTFLKAAGRVGNLQIPIIGVNMGRLGFLANISQEKLNSTIDSIYANNFIIEERSVIRLKCNEKDVIFNPFALNDIAILKRDIASMISIHVEINGEFLTSYLADGLVISTPTGSTAYSLSIGGPIMVPQTNTLSITPVAPHSLNMRPIVVSDESKIRLDVESRSHNFLVAIDGRSVKMKEGTTLTIQKANHKVKIIKTENNTFFNTLREKLMWGADTRQLYSKSLKEKNIND